MDVRDDEIDLRDVVTVVRKRWALIVVPAAIVAAIVFGMMKALPKQYESDVLLRIGSIGERQLENIPALIEIMDSQYFREEIAKGVNNDQAEYIKSLKGSIKYSDEKDLLSIVVHENTPEKAQALARVAAAVIMERHRVLYENGRSDIDRTLKYIKSTVNPVPLSIGVSEMRLEPTRIEVPANLNYEPVSRKIRIVVLAAFFAVLMLDMFIAFYIEGKEESK